MLPVAVVAADVGAAVVADLGPARHSRCCLGFPRDCSFADHRPAIVAPVVGPADANYLEPRNTYISVMFMCKHSRSPFDAAGAVANPTNKQRVRVPPWDVRET